MGLKGGRRVSWQPNRHLWAHYLENVGASTSQKPMGPMACYRDSFPFLIKRTGAHTRAHTWCYHTPVFRYGIKKFVWKVTCNVLVTPWTRSVVLFPCILFPHSSSESNQWLSFNYSVNGIQLIFFISFSSPYIYLKNTHNGMWFMLK
jgi:hypothetical protein